MGRLGIPEGQRGGVSLAPIIPFVPLAFWGVALLADLAIWPWGTVWGTVVVSWFHVVIGVVFVGSIARDWWRLRTLVKEP
jgi:hypothetical protein